VNSTLLDRTFFRFSLPIWIDEITEKTLIKIVYKLSSLLSILGSYFSQICKLSKAFINYKKLNLVSVLFINKNRINLTIALSEWVYGLH
jgi:hypothetical protein